MPDNLKKSNETFQIIYFLKAYSYEHAKIRKIHYHNDIFRLYSGPGQFFCLKKSFEKKLFHLWWHLMQKKASINLKSF